MSEQMRLILGIVATFGLLVLIAFIMSCIVAVCDNKEKKRETRPGKIFAREIGRVIASQSVSVNGKSECYCYFYNNKNGHTKDILIMDAKTPKEATRILSTRYGKWIKPTREKISFWIPVGG